MAILDKILHEISIFPVERVYLNGFNEPSYDKGLIDKVTRIQAAGYQIHLNSNGSGLKPTLTDALIEAGVTSFCINISTVDGARYRQTRGTHDLQRVLRNLPHLLRRAREKAVEVRLMVLGSLDNSHLTEIQDIGERFQLLPQELFICPIVSYACDHRPTIAPNGYRQSLKGCAEGRHQRFLHFNADGRVIFCCQDYDGAYPIGDVTTQSISEIFYGETMQKFRRWLEGEEEAPEDFLCRTCIKCLDDNKYSAANYFAMLRAKFCDTCMLRAGLGQERACGRCVVGHSCGLNPNYSQERAHLV